MSGKKQYHGLDEVGFVGTQSRNKARVQADIDKTVQFLKVKKAGHPNSPVKKNNPVSKSK